MPTFTSLFHTLSHSHTEKCSLFTCQKHHQTMSYSAPLWVQWEVPGPTSPYTISPKACPTPTIVPHSTHTHSQWPLQSQGSHYTIPSHKDTHQSLSRQREKRMTVVAEEKLRPLGRDGGKRVKHKVQSVCGGSVDNILGRERHSKQAIIVCAYVPITRV